MNIFTKRIATQLNLPEQKVENTLALLEEGCTIPFISRYRKEKTGGMDEVQIAQIAEMNDKCKEIAKRKETIIKTITEQGKMNAELQQRIDNCWEATELEDIYLPYKPKRRTRAQIAREQGLEPLADIIMLQRERNPIEAAQRFVGGSRQRGCDSRSKRHHCRKDKRGRTVEKPTARGFQTFGRYIIKGRKDKERH